MFEVWLWSTEEDSEDGWDERRLVLRIVKRNGVILGFQTGTAAWLELAYCFDSCYIDQNQVIRKT